MATFHLPVMDLSAKLPWYLHGERLSCCTSVSNLEKFMTVHVASNEHFVLLPSADMIDSDSYLYILTAQN